jgi:anaerobic magnesium-protoporphyrin IX monomethyl ester cyclase
MKICFVRPPSIVEKTAFIAALTPPISIAYVAASVRQAGHDVTIIDAIGENPRKNISYSEHHFLRGISFDEIVEHIPENSELIGIACMFSSEWTPTRQLLKKIRARFAKAFIVGGGEHFTAAPELSMDQALELDACILGEGEESMVELAGALSEGYSLNSVPGLLFRNGQRYQKTGARLRLRNIDEIPPPAWDLVPLENYLQDHLGYGVDRGRSIPMIASRGCPYQCTFCSSPNMWGTRWLARNPKLVADEIELYVKDYNIQNVDFYDLTAIVKRNWIIDFCNELIDRKINITWQLPSGTRSEAIDKEVSRLLYTSGCRNMNYAPESGSERTLKNIKKKVNLDRLIASLKAALSEGLNVKINIIIGLPDETHGDIWKTFRLLIRTAWHGANDMAIGVFAPYPGSELYSRLVEEGKIDHSDTYFDKLANVDITQVVSYCNHVSAPWLKFYNWLGFVFFYAANYLFRPSRLVRTVRNLMQNKHESRGEMALRHLLARLNIAPPARPRDL